MSRKKKKVGILKWIILLSMAGVFGLLSWWSWAIKPYSSADNSVKITISPGTTAAQLAVELEQRHLIRSAWAFRYLARVRKDEFRLYVGDYQLAPKMPPDEMINRLTKSATMMDAQRVTIPEGYTTEQIIDLLVQKGISSKTDLTNVITDDSYPYSFLENTPNGVHRFEGYLFPNTYEINKNSSPHAVIDIFLQQFEKELTSEVKTQLNSKKLSVSQWVTLASLVEKEAVKESDRPLIAAVFLNRLKINQPLQSCATIQFLLGTPKPVLYEKDLQIPSPYNTYLHPGLPPGPIANPGHASLQAVLHPTQTDFLYFVAKKDGYHAFAKTYNEHLKNVKLYQ